MGSPISAMLDSIPHAQHNFLGVRKSSLGSARRGLAGPHLLSTPPLQPLKVLVLDAWIYS